MDIGMVGLHTEVVGLHMEVEVEVVAEGAVLVGVEGGMVVEICSRSRGITMVMVVREPFLLKPAVISVLIRNAFFLLAVYHFSLRHT